MNDEPKCPKCGSADVERVQLPGGADADDQPTLPVGEGLWRCLRDDHEFTAHPCPNCGAHNIEGAQAMSGAPLIKPQVAVRCYDCGEQFAPHPTVAG